MNAGLKTSPFVELGSGDGSPGMGGEDPSPSPSLGGKQPLFLNFKHPKVIDLDHHLPGCVRGFFRQGDQASFVQNCPNFSLESYTSQVSPLPSSEKARMVKIHLAGREIQSTT